MAAESPVSEPMCLIENSQEKGLVVRQEALQVLSEITQPVVVVAIAGLYRTGKSYLMNRLARERRGFSLGSTVQSQTKGIWMWCLPHPCQPGHTLVLLDTEGLADVDKGDTQNDTWIFVLAVLLSSTLVYNSKGTIDQEAMNKLHYVLKLTELVKLKAAPQSSEDELKDSDKFVLFFPTFVWAVRDFTLQLRRNGQPISEDEYLENALKLKAGTSPEIQSYNQPRECIRQFFPGRKCFTFCPPANWRDMEHLEELQDDEIDPEFQKQVENFCIHIWKTSPPKSVPGGHIITGILLGKLSVTYVEAIRSGAVPCVESAVLALATVQNTAAVTEAATLYQGLMAQRVKLPTETLEELLELHSQCEREMLELFMARAFEDDIKTFQTQLLRQVQEIKEKFLKDNEQASREKCEAALRDLSQDTERQIRAGVYRGPGGYDRLCKDHQRFMTRYQALPGKGVKAQAVLLEFLQRRKILIENILTTDPSLTEEEKKMRSTEMQNTLAEMKRRVQRMEETERKQQLKNNARSLEENANWLRKKLKLSCETHLQEHDKMIKLKSEEEDALRREGFYEKAEHMHTVQIKLEEEKISIWKRFIRWIKEVVTDIFYW
ncbi:guanylate-binding protein 1-like [Colius striatus]|uniref:guanylate-binding protein 1-like n=1 Tax=Colius striatus TaxID=57412 RepID=UPI002B1E4057|nr:guanylate-binding protein 1-like [Colius striatus]XP_061876191.1 guanylate-binding protein 1-like [Colius striatus]XP_061876192.1 guanylate-binding protein 1-like [Colius striatus]XP_061876193.1 guanylate-binding protein 1-like [Colius striatus]XP_061876194.1 guanylate-binding protein 1-like [Colius striatus]